MSDHAEVRGPDAPKADKPGRSREFKPGRQKPDRPARQPRAAKPRLTARQFAANIRATREAIGLPLTDAEAKREAAYETKRKQVAEQVAAGKRTGPRLP